MIEGQLNSTEWRLYLQEAILEKMWRKINDSWVWQQAMNDMEKNLTSSFLDMRGQDRTQLQSGAYFHYLWIWEIYSLTHIEHVNTLNM